MNRFFTGLFSTLEGQLADARDYALDTPSISSAEYSFEHLLVCLALIRQAQMTVEELKSHVAKICADEPKGTVVQ